jgi:phosphoribosylformylglycinamidine cyclo-ligase
MSQSHYARLGVDAGKETVRKTFAKVIDNDYPGAWVNIVNDPTKKGGVFTQHMDGDGSKFIQRILIYRELGDIAVFRGAADDAFSMNMGDIAAAGFTSGIITVTDVLNLNSFSVPKQQIMEQLSDRLSELIKLYRKFGFNIYFLGGETADLPHQVQTVAFDIAVHARAMKKDLVLGNVRHSDTIWGFASDGQAVWEDELNSGIMSNGLTLARMALMSRAYTQKYPDLVRIGGTYEGRFRVTDSEWRARALISPTRQWAVVIKLLLDKLKERKIIKYLHGITMNTGSGATKIANLGTGGIVYQKTMPYPPKIFHAIQAASNESWRDMYKDFNCGVGIDIIGDEKIKPVLLEVLAETGVGLYQLGICHYRPGNEKNKVELITPFGTFEYS